MRFILYGTKYISAAVRTGKKSTYTALHLNFEYPPKSVYKLQSLPSEGDGNTLVSKWQDQRTLLI